MSLVVLVDEKGDSFFDKEGRLATIDKFEAHRRGLRHSAVSVFIFNGKNELLLQKRSSDKYHSAGLWANTCCTHPLPGEAPIAGAQRRLREEMGLTADLTELFTFSYRADVGNGLIENEYDYVFGGISKRDPLPNPTEVSDWAWINLKELEQSLMVNPARYCVWLTRCFREVIQTLGVIRKTPQLPGKGQKSRI